jgi:hypothetical protein
MYESDEPDGCQYCIEVGLFRTQPLDEYGDCPHNPDEFRRCELAREAQGVKEADDD